MPENLTLLARITVLSALLAGVLLVAGKAAPKVGPFNPEAWPPTANPAKTVHYAWLSEGPKPPSATWTPNLKFLTGGDQVTETVQAGGHEAVRVSMIKFNTADDHYAFWADKHSIDILIQFFGDGAHLNPDGTAKYFNFLTGTLPEPIAVDGGEISPAARNGKWNWAAFRISNGLRHMDGGRLVGTIHPKAKENPGILGVSVNSGQNGGTIRMDGLHDLKIRVVAFGEKGAFGDPDAINRY